MPSALPPRSARSTRTSRAMTSRWKPASEGVASANLCQAHGQPPWAWLFLRCFLAPRSFFRLLLLGDVAAVVLQHRRPLGIERDVTLPAGRHLLLEEDSLDGAHRHAAAAVDAV